MGDPLSTTAGTGPDPPAKVAAKIEELLRDQMDDAAFELQHMISGSGDARTECFETDTKR
ncbi:hypothetical protein [Rhizobium sp. LjRoot258]|jgi:hypothetical protein|uniref:hypothetical protein n=1 Tax=Rhizobium sp. LjRoot258 TaxID=3342299 RepID=UPI003ECE19FB